MPKTEALDVLFFVALQRNRLSYQMRQMLERLTRYQTAPTLLSFYEFVTANQAKSLF